MGYRDRTHSVTLRESELRIMSEMLTNEVAEWVNSCFDPSEVERLDKLLRIAEEINQQVPGTRLDIDGDYTAELRARFEEWRSC
jgi:hypothetical protein